MPFWSSATARWALCSPHCTWQQMWSAQWRSKSLCSTQLGMAPQRWKMLVLDSFWDTGLGASRSWCCEFIRCSWEDLNFSSGWCQGLPVQGSSGDHMFSTQWHMLGLYRNSMHYVTGQAREAVLETGISMTETAELLKLLMPFIWDKLVTAE